MATELRTCYRCGQTTSEYGIDKEKRAVCYSCCAEANRASMDETGRAVLYFTITEQGEYGRGYRNLGTVTNWPGTLSYPAQFATGKHNMGLTRYDVWFTDYKDRRWHGVTIGDNTQLCHCRRLQE